MKYLLSLLTALLCISCTSIKPVEISPQDLQQKIISHEFLAIGDPVKITTINGEIYNFEITEITSTEILGDNVQVAIADIIAIETEQFSGGKTTAVVGGTVVTAIVVAGVLGMFELVRDLSNIK